LQTDVEHGVGLRELRVRDEAGNFRVIYIAALADAV
jgi:phage-related protein